MKGRGEGRKEKKESGEEGGKGKGCIIIFVNSADYTIG